MAATDLSRLRSTVTCRIWNVPHLEGPQTSSGAAVRVAVAELFAESVVSNSGEGAREVRNLLIPHGPGGTDVWSGYTSG